MIAKNIFLIILLSLLCFPVFAQEQKPTPADTARMEEVKPIDITEIPDELEKLNKEISDTWKLLHDTLSIAAVDSIMPFAQYYLDSVKMIFNRQKDIFSYRGMENFLSEWSTYARRLESWRNIVSSKFTLLNDEGVEMKSRIRQWEITLQDLVDRESGEQLQDNISRVIDSLNIIKSSLSARTEFSINLQNNITDKILIVDNVLGTIKQKQRELQVAYFYRDSDPIWAKSDSSRHPKNTISHTVQLFNNNTRAINIFLSNNKNSSYLHLLIFITLLALLFIIRRKVVKLNLVTEDKEFQTAKALLYRPTVVALFLSLMAGLLIYTNRPVIFTEALFIVILIPLFILLPMIISAQFNFFLRIMIALFVLDELQLFLDPSSLFRRILLLIVTLIATWLFYSFWKFKKHNPDIPYNRMWRIFMSASSIFIFFLVISVIGNTLGYVRLASYITGSIVSATLVTAIFFLLMTIFKSFTLFGLRLYHRDYWHNEFRINIQEKTDRIISIAITILWVIVVLRIFNIYSLLIEWFYQVMDIEWTFGKADTTISVGGIISFILIIIITFLLASGTKKLFKSNFILRSKIPRGVPAAISMLARYIIVVFGVYIALAAAGVDLGQFGLIAGALGVGIGFGLQNVVYNFISGLIISFERPIHVGDTIEVGTLMGRVTEIGVRSSKVMTFDGSEVIVPNGNLISKEVVNWTLSDQKRRLMIKVRTDYNADPQRVLSIIRKEAEKHPNTLKEPAVMALFDGYGDSSLDFTLYFWVHFHVSFTSKSEVALSLYEALKAEGIGVPIPMQRWYYDKEKNQEEHPGNS
ncbi:MAG: mechanosensitive ion channel [Bacteroidota bacterium]|nr:mechanosensitive ion channel [Bacteroidota bacterium]